jgi:hypothetical protein
VGDTTPATTHGDTPHNRRRRRGMSAGPFAMVFAGAALVISLCNTPIEERPGAAPTTVPALAVLRPVDASKPQTAPETPLEPTPGNCAEYVGLALTIGWPATEAPQLAQIMRSESRCYPDRIGDQGNSYGLLQIHCPTWVAKTRYWPEGWAAVNGYPITCTDLLDPKTNLAIGFLIWAGVEGSSGGWWNWTTYRP